MPKPNVRVMEAAYKASMLRDSLRLFARHTTARKAANLGLCAAEYSLRRERVDSWPIEATIEPTNMCNLRCPYCRTGRGVEGRPKGRMRFDAYKGIIDEIGDYLYVVSLFSHGEPFLSEDLLRMAGYARDRNIASVVHTNLNVRLSDEEAGGIVESGLTVLSASIDGASDRTYGEYRVGGSLGQVLANIDAINRKKMELGSQWPRLTWQYLLFRHNEGEVEAARRMAGERGMRFRVVSPKAPDSDRSGLKGVRPTHGQGRGCHFPWTTANYAWDGSIVPCCQAYDVRDDLDGSPAGSFRRAWNNDKTRALRRYFRRIGGPVGGDVICQRCPEDYFWMSVSR